MIRIEQATDYNIEEVEILNRGLDHNAFVKRGLGPVEYFAFYLRDDANQIVGGCSGLTYYGCLYIDQLWIDEKLRGKHYGSKLMEAVEQMARDKGCVFATTDTMDWEALDFYKKLGYEVEAEVHGYHNNVVMYRMRKDW